MEKDLFNPIKKYFEADGYICDGEVNDIDLYMQKDDKAIAVELKQTFDFKALQQAALRQKICDTVYIGIFKPRDLRSHSFTDKIYLLKRLGIGLIVVSKRSGQVEIVSDPVVSELSLFQRSNAYKRKALEAEFKGRKAKNNTGGVHGTKIITSYREATLLVLDALMECGGVGKTKDVREISGIKSATSIMYQNHYGWFKNLEKGVYGVTEAGLLALEEFEGTMVLLKKNKERTDE